LNLNELKLIKKKFGWKGVSHALKYSALNKFTFYKELQGMIVTMETLDPKYLNGNPAYVHGFLDEAQLRQFSKDSETQITDVFLDRVLPKGDRCYAIMDGGRLAAYGWYSTKPTNINKELVLHFDPHWVYMYKGYTHPDYRGQRLHAIGMAKALEAFTKEGYKGLISYVETNNFASLRSVFRMGYRNICKVRIFKGLGSYHITTEPECEKYQFTVKTQT
jgi:ribosomal protein S18 acetylase RimI-like enzyme